MNEPNMNGYNFQNASSTRTYSNPHLSCTPSYNFTDNAFIVQEFFRILGRFESVLPIKHLSYEYNVPQVATLIGFNQSMELSADPELSFTMKTLIASRRTKMEELPLEKVNTPVLMQITKDMGDAVSIAASVGGIPRTRPIKDYYHDNRAVDMNMLCEDIIAWRDGTYAPMKNAVDSGVPLEDVIA